MNITIDSRTTFINIYKFRLESIKKIFWVLLLLIVQSVHADEIVTYYSTFTPASERARHFEYCGTDPSYRNTQTRREMTSDKHCAGQYPWDAEHVGDFVGGYVVDTREWRVVYEECWHNSELYDYIEVHYDRTFERICKWECLYTPPADFIEVGLCSEKQNYIDAGVSPDDLECGCYKESETDGSDQTPLYQRDSNSSNCREPDIYFPTIPDHHITLFTWDEEDNDRSSECAYQHGIKQNARIDCQEQYRCIRHTDECQWERNENVGSYVSPRDGVFHEDIDIDGTAYTLHYQSADVAVGSIADGWSVSAHAVLKEGTLYMGDGARYLVDTVEQEGDKNIYPLGAIELIFDADNRHSATRDSYTKSVIYTFAYDSSHNLIGITDHFSNTTTIMHDADGKAERIIAPHGQVTLLDVNDDNDMVSVIYEDGATYSFEYEDHLMTKEREPKGNTFLHIFNSQAKIVEVVDAEQGVWNFAQESETNAELTSVIRASGDSVQYRNHHLKNGFLRSEKIKPNGDVVIKEAAVDDSETHVSSCGIEKVYTYKMHNGLLVKDPIEHKRILAASSTTMPSGLTQLNSYDTAYTFEGDTLIKSMTTTETNGALATNERDYSLSTSVLTTPEGRKTTITYDQKSLLPTTIQNGTLAALSYLYDDEGRVIESAQGNRAMRYTYDSRGNVATVYNVSRDTTTRYRYDERDRVTQIVYPDGHTTQFAYDANGNMSRLTTPIPADHDFGYNGVNKRASYTSPLGSATYYSYDKQRRVTQITRPSGKQISNTYTNGQLSRVTTPEGTTDYVYTCGDKPESITKGSESLSFTYDGDLLTRIRQSGILDQSIGYTYNNDFRVTSSTYAGATTDYSYDMDGLLTSSGDFTLLRDVNNSLVTEITDGSHRVKLGYNAFGEIKSQSSDAYDLQLRYDEGRIAHKTETLTKTVPNKKGKGAKKVKERSSYSYSYDNRDRLTEVYKDKELVERYAYDANGNRASATVYGVTTTASYTLDDQLVVYGDNTYYYDEDGYLTEKTTPEGTTTYTYGTLGELLSVETPTLSIEYLHNVNNQRVAKKVNGVITEKYLWANLTTLLAIYDRNDNLLQRFEYADQRMPIAMTQDNQKYYLHYDQVGSLRAVSDVTDEVVKEVAYDTFGNIVSDSDPDFKMPFGFAGGLFDPDTGLTRFGYRDYDAYTGKWTAKDPIGFDGGDTNLYGYVLGDPVNFVDPMGKSGLGAGGGLHLGIIGGNAHVVSNGSSTSIMICGRFGPGLFAGWGTEVSIDLPVESGVCSNTNHDVSVGVGVDIGLGSPAFGASASTGTNGTSVTGSGGVGASVGFSLGAEACYIYTF